MKTDGTGEKNACLFSFLWDFPLEELSKVCTYYMSV